MFARIKEQIKGYEDFIVIMAIIIVGAAIYANALYGEFISDDYVAIVKNQSVRNLGDIKGVWKSYNTRFLVGVTFALNFMHSQLDVFGYHLVNIIVHLIVAGLVYWLVLVLFQTPALKDHALKGRARMMGVLACFVFLCHPLQTQSVAYITQRATSMATLFYVLTLILYIKGRVKNDRRYTFAGAGALLIGAFCKEMTITAPFVLFVCEIFFFETSPKQWRDLLKRLWIFILVIGVLPVLLSFDRPGSVLNLKGQLVTRTFNWNYFLVEINVLRTYLRLMFLPINQTHHYDYPYVHSFFEPWTLFSVFLLTGILTLSFLLFKKRRLLSFTILWFFITTSVEVVVVSFVNRGVIYEHWTYLAMVGFSIFVPLVLMLLIKDARIIIPVGLVIVLLCCGATVRRNTVWQDEMRFWEDVIQKSPESSLVYLGVGTAYQRKEHYEEAMRYFQKGLYLFKKKKKGTSELDRVYLARMFNNMGLIYHETDRNEEAVKYFKKALSFNPRNSSTYHNLAKVCLDLKRYKDAIKFLRRSMRYQGTYPEAYLGIGIAYRALGYRQASAENLKKALAVFEEAGNERKIKQAKALLMSLSGVPLSRVPAAQRKKVPKSE